MVTVADGPIRVRAVRVNRGIGTEVAAPIDRTSIGGAGGVRVASIRVSGHADVARSLATLSWIAVATLFAQLAADAPAVDAERACRACLVVLAGQALGAEQRVKDLAARCAAQHHEQNDRGPELALGRGDHGCHPV